MSINTDYLDSDDYKIIVDCLKNEKEKYRRDINNYFYTEEELNKKFEVENFFNKIDVLIKIFTKECHS